MLQADEHGHIISHFGVTLFGSDFHTLRPAMCLNDNVGYFLFSFIDYFS